MKSFEKVDEKIEKESSFGKIEFKLDSERDLERLEKWLVEFVGKEGAEQCVFVLKTMREERFSNKCDVITKEFGKRLRERYGEEESFFDLVPSAEYSEARSTPVLDKINWRGEHHSVGILGFNFEEEDDFSLIIDLTYSGVSTKCERDTMVMFNFPGGRKEALEGIENHYGGSWKVMYNFDKETGRYVFAEK